MLGVLTGSGFERDEAVVSTSVSQFLLLELHFFLELGFRVYVLLMMLLTNFLYLVIFVDFLVWDGANSFFIYVTNLSKKKDIVLQKSDKISLLLGSSPASFV